MKKKWILSWCGFVLLMLAAALPQTVSAQTNYYWTTPVGSLLVGGSPQSATADTAGNVYLADAKQVILKISPLGTNWIFTTIAGLAGTGGTSNGTNSTARFSNPGGVTADAAGNLYVADSGNNAIRKIIRSGTNWITTTIAGVANPSIYGSINGTNGAARFAFPLGIAVDAAGNLFIGDNGNVVIRKIRHSGTNWITTTIAGTSGTSGYLDGTNGAAQFAYPFGVAVDAAGNVYVADAVNEIIRKVTPSGTNWIVTTIAGQAGYSGSADGTNLDAQFNFPTGINVDNAGNVYVCDTFNDTIRKLTPDGTNWIVTTIGGYAGIYGLADGTNDVAAFGSPQGVALDSDGNVYVGDTGNNALRIGFLFPPSLHIAADAHQTALTYPVALGTNFSFTLQSTTNLANAWADVTNQWQLDSNGTPYITLTNKVPGNFFRLELPESP